MNASWLESLSTIDTWVLGGIVGSVMLAFVLVVVIFSIRIKIEHDHLRHLQEEIAERDRRIRTEQARHKKAYRDAADAQTVIAHYQQQEKELVNELTGIRRELEAAKRREEKLQRDVRNLSGEKQKLVTAVATLRADLEQARAEVDAARKRNEFWIAQMAELRTKHEALKHKITFQKGRTA